MAKSYDEMIVIIVKLDSTALTLILWIQFLISSSGTLETRRPCCRWRESKTKREKKLLMDFPQRSCSCFVCFGPIISDGNIAARTLRSFPKECFWLNFYRFIMRLKYCANIPERWWRGRELMGTKMKMLWSPDMLCCLYMLRSGRSYVACADWKVFHHFTGRFVWATRKSLLHAQLNLWKWTEWRRIFLWNNFLISVEERKTNF